ncbi:MAG: PspC domain-containing protein [Pseudomonadota bacterium]
MNAADRFYRPDDALLAGLCAEIARRLGWNVWALRLLFVVGLFVNALVAGAVYLLGAVAMGLLLSGRSSEKTGSGRLGSEHLAERAERIEALEEKFRALEREKR